jgi:hypothetical protein
MQFALQAAELLFFLGDLGLQSLANVDQGRSFLRVALFAGGLGDFVLAAANFFDALKKFPALALECDSTVDILQNVSRGVPVPAILFDRVGVGHHILYVQHVTLYTPSCASR